MMNNLEKILEGVARETNLPVEIIRGKNRLAKNVNARRNFLFLARKYTSHSYLEIAKVIKLSHSSAIHHVNKHRDLCDIDKKYARDAFIIEQGAVSDNLLNQDKFTGLLDKMLIINQKLKGKILALENKNRVLTNHVSELKKENRNLKLY